MKGEDGANRRLVKQLFTERIAGKCLRTEIRLRIYPINTNPIKIDNTGIG